MRNLFRSVNIQPLTCCTFFECSHGSLQFHGGGRNHNTVSSISDADTANNATIVRVCSDPSTPPTMTGVSATGGDNTIGMIVCIKTEKKAADTESVPEEYISGHTNRQAPNKDKLFSMSTRF